MPREHVESCYATPQEPTTGPCLPPFRVEVGWDRYGAVQVATMDPDAELGSRESGLYVDLDRGGINNLIRLLRKARDQAFGRDE